MNTDKNLLDTPVGSIVASNYNTANTFLKYDIDFYYNGELPLSEACQNRGLPWQQVLADVLTTLQDEGKPGIDYNSWPLDRLVNYIEKVLHRYVSEKIFQLQQWLDQCVAGYPELLNIVEVRDIFQSASNDLLVHLMAEKQVWSLGLKHLPGPTQSHRSRSNHEIDIDRLTALMREHKKTGLAFKKIARLTNDYTTPESATGLLAICYAGLKEFQEDLLFQMHLENNIVLPKVKKLVITDLSSSWSETGLGLGLGNGMDVRQTV